MKPFFLAFIWSRIGSEKRHTKENVQLNSCRLRWLVLGWMMVGWLVCWLAEMGPRTFFSPALALSSERFAFCHSTLGVSVYWSAEIFADHIFN